MTTMSNIFEDNFDAPEIDSNNWNFELWNAGTFNDELQSYTSSPNNAFIEDNHLVIRSLRRKFTYRFNKSKLKSI